MVTMKVNGVGMIVLVDEFDINLITFTTANCWTGYMTDTAARTRDLIAILIMGRFRGVGP